MYLSRCGSIYEVTDIHGKRFGYFGCVSDLRPFGLYYSRKNDHLWVLDLHNSRPRFFLSYATGFKYISSLEV